MAGKTGKSTALLGICFVKETRYKVGTDGKSVADGDNIYYFQSSSVYSEAAVTTATGVNYINPDTWEGKEPLIKVEQMILSGKLERIYVEVDPGGDKATKKLSMFCIPSKMITVRDATGGLIGKDIKTTRGGVSKTLGKVFNVRSKTTDRYK
jgi:hypothetical protein